MSKGGGQWAKPAPTVSLYVAFDGRIIATEMSAQAGNRQRFQVQVIRYENLPTTYHIYGSKLCRIPHHVVVGVRQTTKSSRRSLDLGFGGSQ